MKALAEKLMAEDLAGCMFHDIGGALVQASYHVSDSDQQEALAKELLRLSPPEEQRPVVWVLWVDRGAGGVAYSREYADDVQWLPPGPHFTRCGTYGTEAAVKAAARKEEDYFSSLPA